MTKVNSEEKHRSSNFRSFQRKAKQQKKLCRSVWPWGAWLSQEGNMRREEGRGVGKEERARGRGQEGCEGRKEGRKLEKDLVWGPED